MIVPTTRYSDCDAALVFLKEVIGMKELTVHRDDAGTILHAELTMGDSLFMFGPETPNAFARYMTAPRDTGGRETSTMYVIVEDVETHNVRAMAAGADIVQPLEEPPYGGLHYSLRDTEGHVWTVGDYDPRR